MKADNMKFASITFLIRLSLVLSPAVAVSLASAQSADELKGANLLMDVDLLVNAAGAQSQGDKGAKVTVVLNGVIVVDNAIFLQGKIPAEGPIELQVHGTPLWFRNVFVREITAEKK